MDKLKKQPVDPYLVQALLAKTPLKKLGDRKCLGLLKS
jgi:hypothetical protein